MSFNKFISAATAVVTLGVLSACNPKSGPVTPPAYGVEFAATHMFGYYYGTAETGSDETANYGILLSNLPEEEYLSANGIWYRFDCYGKAAGDAAQAFLPEGTYKLSETVAPSTFSAEYSLYFTIDEEGEDTQYPFTDGELVVRKDGDKYIYDFVGTVNGESHHVSWRGGDVILSNDSGEGGSDAPALEEDINTTFTLAAAKLYSHEDNCTNLLLQLSDMSLDGEGYLTPPGTLVSIDLYTVPIAEGETDIPAGKYTVADEYYIENTFYKGEYYDGEVIPTAVVYFDEDANASYGIVDGGDITISESSKGVKIELDLTYDGHACKGVYEGPLALSGNDAPASESTLTGDYEVDFSKGASVGNAYFFGDYYKQNTANWTILIEPAAGSSLDDGFVADLICDGKTFEEGIIPGEYTVSGSEDVNTALKGSLSNNGISGTFYCGGYTESGVTKYATAKSGKVTVSKAADGKYTVSFDCLDDASHRFYGTWTGDFALSNETSASAAVASKSVRADRKARSVKYSRGGAFDIGSLRFE